jgi:predicted Zn-dependent peptidase
MFKQTKLKNGIKTIYVPVPGTKAVTVLVLCKVGSRYETKNINGASHFIEHLMFKGTERRPTTLDISQELDSIGAEFNAATAKDWTGYYIKTTADHIDLALDMLSDMIWNSKFDPVEFKREKGVIIEEINMYQDNPLIYLDDILEQAMFGGSTLGWEIAGQRGIIKKMKRNELVNFRDKYYQPQNMVLVIAGDMDNARRLAPKYFGGLKAKTKNKPGKFKKFSGFSAKNKLRCELRYKKTEQVHLALGFPGFSYDAKDMPILQLIHVILGANMSSRLFIAIRERQGLAYYVRSSVDSYEDTGIFSIRSGLDRHRLSQAADILKSEINKFKSQGATKEELKKAKEYIKGKLRLGLEDSATQAEYYGKQALLMKQVKTPRQRLTETGRVTSDDIARVSKKIFDWSRAGVAVIGPYRKKSEVLKLFK